jgi:hypothetical protein
MMSIPCDILVLSMGGGPRLYRSVVSNVVSKLTPIEPYIWPGCQELLFSRLLSNVLRFTSTSLLIYSCFYTFVPVSCSLSFRRLFVHVKSEQIEMFGVSDGSIILSASMHQSQTSLCFRTHSKSDGNFMAYICSSTSCHP